MTSSPLLTLLQDHALRKELIYKNKLAITTEESMKLRFCCAMIDYEAQEEGESKQQRGLELYSTFIAAASLFQLADIPPELTQNADQLPLVLKHVLQELDQVPALKEQVASAPATPPAQEKEQQEQEDGSDTDEDEEAFPLPTTSSPRLHRPKSIAEMGVLRRRDPETVAFYDTVVASPTITPRRKLSLMPPVFRSKASSSIAPNAPSFSAEQRALEQLIANSFARHTLILELARTNAELSIKVRLCQAIHEYVECAPGSKERQARARKIASTFIKPGSLFCVSLGSENESIFIDLVGADESKFDRLIDLQHVLLQELLKDEVVRTHVFAQDGTTCQEA